MGLNKIIPTNFSPIRRAVLLTCCVLQSAPKRNCSTDWFVVRDGSGLVSVEGLGIRAAEPSTNSLKGQSPKNASPIQ